jgi:hypothetical protein
MTQIILLVLFIVLVSFKIYQNYSIESRLKEIKKRQDNTDLVVVKLMFHKAQEIEDYETCKRIKETMGNNFELYKF